MEVRRSGHNEVFAGKSGQSIAKTILTIADFLKDDAGDEIDLCGISIDGHAFLNKGTYHICDTEMLGCGILLEGVILGFEQLNRNLFRFFSSGQWHLLPLGGSEIRLSGETLKKCRWKLCFHAVFFAK